MKQISIRVNRSLIMIMNDISKVSRALSEVRWNPVAFLTAHACTVATASVGF